MDNMAAGWDRPQEDEFALCNMGMPSPYLTIAFSNRPPQYQEYFELERVSPAAGALEAGAAVVLEVPDGAAAEADRAQVAAAHLPHQGAVGDVSQGPLRPHRPQSVRDLSLDGQPLEAAVSQRGFAGSRVSRVSDEHVFETFERMYEVFERRPAADPARPVCEVRYEDLVADPLGQMRAVYERLGLGDFEEVRPAMEAYFAEKADYKTNRYPASPPERAEIARRWGRIWSTTATARRRKSLPQQSEIAPDHWGRRNGGTKTISVQPGHADGGRDGLRSVLWDIAPLGVSAPAFLDWMTLYFSTVVYSRWAPFGGCHPYGASFFLMSGILIVLAVIACGVVLRLPS